MYYQNKKKEQKIIVEICYEELPLFLCSRRNFDYKVDLNNIFLTLCIHFVSLSSRIEFSVLGLQCFMLFLERLAVSTPASFSGSHGFKPWPGERLP
jgi:hypothetical protein